jgi:hypothetical protein
LVAAVAQPRSRKPIAHHCLESIQVKAHRSKERRESERPNICRCRLCKRFEEGNEPGFALCLAEGTEKGRNQQHGPAQLKSHRLGLPSRLCINTIVIDILEQSNGVATEPTRGAQPGLLFYFFKLVSRFGPLEEKKGKQIQIVIALSVECLDF